MTQTQTVPKTQARWTRRKLARPSEILDAAVAVFAERGFAAARMDDIARRAGVTKGTIYLYFEGKEDVFKTLVRESIGQTIAVNTAAAQQFEGPSSDLIRIVLTAISNLLLNSDRIVLPKIIISEAGNFPELARFYREEVVDRGLALLIGIVERGIARGEFRRLASDHVARLCMAPFLLIVMWRTSFARFDTTPFDVQAFVQTHIGVLLRGLAPEGAQA
jgi:AcrR family transcriptional regulator